ncbi:MAG: hypothetical protein ACOX0N_12100 [Syntrophomonadaceae bacterium]|jgi:protein-L-isoaspartate O-methyltransferase|nr:hypothetical protein [Syntrophomonadaceae bacterium]
MIIAIGPSNNQQLFLITKNPHNQIKQTSLAEVRFVEFKSRYGWS